MAKGLIGALRVDLSINSAAFRKGAAEAQGAFANLQRSLSAQSVKLGAIGAGMSLAITTPLIAFGRAAVQGAAESQAAIAAVDAALTSMGGAAGYTTEQLSAMATGLSANSLYDDDEILTKVTANLLTFGNVSGEAFAGAQQAAIDLSARLGTDLQSSTIMVGKALNDPIAGVTALTRVGVSFSAQQKDQIRAMQSAGDTAGAQSLILAELTRQYGGQAAALRDLPMGQIQGAQIDLGNAMETVGAIMLPILADIAKWVSDVAVAFAGLDPNVQTFIVAGAALAAALGPVVVVLGSVVGALGLVLSPIGGLVILAAALAAGAVTLYLNWDALVAKVSGWITDFANWALSFAPVQAAVDYLSAGFTAVGQVVEDVVALVGALLSGDWAAAWGSAKDLAGSLFDYFDTIFAGLPQKAIDGVTSLGAALSGEMGKLVTKMTGWAGNVIDGFVKGFNAQIEAAKGAVTQFANDVGGWFKDVLGIQSPSRVFAGYGDNVVDGLVVGLERSEDRALSAMDRLAQKLKDAGEAAVKGLNAALLDGLAKGDLAGAVKGAIGSYMSEATKATGVIFKDVLSGGGFAAIGTSVTNAFGGIKGALAGGGGFLASLGGIASAAMPLVGLANAVVGIIKGFSSKKITGSGLDLSVENGSIAGSEFTNVEKASFWGLIKKNRTEWTALSADTAEVLNAALKDIQANAKDIFKRAGVNLTNAMVKNFSFDFKQIDTKDKTQEQITTEIEAQFAAYQDALSKAVAGVGLEAVSVFADVSAILKMSGQKLRGSVADMSKAAVALADLFGGAGGLASAQASFIDKFYTDQQKLNLINKDVRQTFAGLNIAVPKTIADFRDLVLAQDLMTEAGRANYAALLGISDAFAFSANAATAALEKQAAKAAEAQAALNETMAAAAEAAAKRVEDAFTALNGRFVTEFDARLAKAGQVNGYRVKVAELGGGGVDVLGLRKSNDLLAMLTKTYHLFDKWDVQGMPNGVRI